MIDNLKIIIVIHDIFSILSISHVHNCTEIELVGVEMSVTRYLVSASNIQETMTSAKHRKARRWIKGVATHFFILRQGLKEYGRIVKFAASEPLSSVSSFFLFYFLQPEFRYVAAALGEFGFRATLPKCTNLGVWGFLRVLFSIAICIPVALVFTVPRWNRELDP